MRRSIWSRTLASLLALWFPLIAGEPGVLHPCPMHGAGTAVSAMLRGVPVHAPAPAAGQSESHAHHSPAAAEHAKSNQAPAPGHDHHDCTCINCCAVSVAALLAPSAPPVEFLVAEYRAARTVPSVESLARPAPEFSRPYTTGPPRA